MGFYRGFFSFAQESDKIVDGGVLVMETDHAGDV